MSPTQATADVFYTAFKALPKAERDAVLVKLSRDRSLRRDLLDLAVIAARREEPSRGFRGYLSEKRKSR
jgi:hypothetical protein